MAKKKKRAGKSALRKVGKITFLYFNGDVGDFIDALTAQLKKPGTVEKLTEAVNAAATAAAAASKSASPS